MNSEDVLSLMKRHDPVFRSNQDAVAYIIHALFSVDGFRLVAIDDESPDTTFEGLPGRWNSNQELYSFRYVHPVLNVSVYLKIIAMEDNLFVHASKTGSDVFSLELHVNDYVSAETKVLTALPSLYNNLDSLILLVKEKIISPIKQHVFSSASGATGRVQLENHPRHLGIRPGRDYDPISVPTPSNDPYDHDPLRMQPQFFQPRYRDFIEDPTAPDGNLMGPNHRGFFPSRGRGRGQMGRYDPTGPDAGFGSGE
jgi:hypothetical protein